MRHAALEDQPTAVSAADVFRPLTDALGLTDIALNHYELTPGDSLGFCYHAHETQEEVFCVTEGVVTFDTEDGRERVAAGELVCFGPGEFQRGFNRGDERAAVLAIGAPRDGGEVELKRACPDCGKRTPHRIEWENGDAVPTCRSCRAETGRYSR
ncbi:cupin domain-containing protein [Halobacterium zhouii]|uniref:cupin domain-containing protein n=1 Tax=Halobacterium zhouii TaxID=2902624 RepID=UPI001E433939|nr:cupin domain-containing protein [Halobacterium zhouii]